MKTIKLIEQYCIVPAGETHPSLRNWGFRTADIVRHQICTGSGEDVVEWEVTPQPQDSMMPRYPTCFLSQKIAEAAARRWVADGYWEPGKWKCGYGKWIASCDWDKYTY